MPTRSPSQGTSVGMDGGYLSADGQTNTDQEHYREQDKHVQAAAENGEQGFSARLATSDDAQDQADEVGEEKREHGQAEKNGGRVVVASWGIIAGFHDGRGAEGQHIPKEYDDGDDHRQDSCSGMRIFLVKALPGKSDADIRIAIVPVIIVVAWHRFAPVQHGVFAATGYAIINPRLLPPP